MRGPSPTDAGGDCGPVSFRDRRRQATMMMAVAFYTPCILTCSRHVCPLAFLRAWPYHCRPLPRLIRMIHKNRLPTGDVKWFHRHPLPGWRLSGRQRGQRVKAILYCAATRKDYIQSRFRHRLQFLLHAGLLSRNTDSTPHAATSAGIASGYIGRAANLLREE